VTVVTGMASAFEKFRYHSERLLSMLRTQVIVLAVTSMGILVLAYLAVGWSLWGILSIMVVLALPIVVDVFVFRQLRYVYSMPGRLKEIGGASRQAGVVALPGTRGGVDDCQVSCRERGDSLLDATGMLRWCRRSGWPRQCLQAPTGSCRPQVMSPSPRE
jgi:hypothetical protein